MEINIIIVMARKAFNKKRRLLIHQLSLDLRDWQDAWYICNTLYSTNMDSKKGGKN